MKYNKVNEVLGWYDIEPIKDNDTEQVKIVKQEFAMLAELDLKTDTSAHYIGMALEELKETIKNN